MSREEILAEITRAAEENGGRALGFGRFKALTGITKHELFRYWPRYGDAVREAGFEPNTMTPAYTDEHLVDKLIELIRELGKFPTEPELIVKKHADSQFPSHNAFRRLGRKAELAAKVLEHCDGKSELDEVRRICLALKGSRASTPISNVSSRTAGSYGFVYLIKGHPGEFKIGHTNLVDRRLSELGATFPIEQELVHTIKTDDPAGVEAYWHKRFENKRMKGEWFRLRPDDVNAFKRWKRIS